MRKVVVHNDPANTVNRYAERFPDERRYVACRPNFHAARNKFAVHLHTFLGNVRGACVRAHFYAKLDQLFSRALGQIRRIRGEQARSAFDQDHSCLRWIDVAKIFSQCVARDFGDRTRHFNTGRATADDDERHRCLARRFICQFFPHIRTLKESAGVAQPRLQDFSIPEQVFPTRHVRSRNAVRRWRE